MKSHVVATGLCGMHAQMAKPRLRLSSRAKRREVKGHSLHERRDKADRPQRPVPSGFDTRRQRSWALPTSRGGPSASPRSLPVVRLLMLRLRSVERDPRGT